VLYIKELNMNDRVGLSIRFATFASQTIAFETGGDKSGGYTNDPSDSGGETKWGISKRAHPELNIKALTFTEALYIYENQYWKEDYDQILSDRIAFKLFDIGVLIGVPKASKLLQETIKDCGLLIRVDGNIGNITIAAINSLEENLLYSKFINRLESHFKRIVFFRPKNKKYLNGWLRRLYYVWKVNNG
jgi:lysozyme family protein